MKLDTQNALLSSCCAGILHMTRIIAKHASECKTISVEEGKFNIDLLAENCAAADSLLSDCASHHPDPPALQEGDDKLVVLACEAMGEVWKMAERFQKICVSRAIFALSKGELQGKPYEAVLPDSHHPIAHALQTDWVEEQKQLQAFDMTSFTKKLSLCDSAVITAEHPLLQDQLFQETRLRCKEFARNFLAGLRSAVEQGSASFIAPLDTFIGKYQSVINAAEIWEMKDISWWFEGDRRDESKQDVSDLKVAKKEATKFAAEITTLLKCYSETAMVADVLKDAKAAETRVRQKISEVCKLAVTFIMVEAVFDKTLTSEDLDETERICVKFFDVGKDQMPDKLKEMLKSIKPKSSGSKKETDKDKRDKQKKEQKDRHKQEKKEKKETGDKDRKRKSQSNNESKAEAKAHKRG